MPGAVRQVKLQRRSRISGDVKKQAIHFHTISQDHDLIQAGCFYLVFICKIMRVFQVLRYVMFNWPIPQVKGGFKLRKLQIYTAGIGRFRSLGHVRVEGNLKFVRAGAVVQPVFSLWKIDTAVSSGLWGIHRIIVLAGDKKKSC